MVDEEKNSLVLFVLLVFFVLSFVLVFLLALESGDRCLQPPASAIRYSASAIRLVPA